MVFHISHMLISFQMDIDSALLLYHGRVLRLVRVWPVMIRKFRGLIMSSDTIVRMSNYASSCFRQAFQSRFVAGIPLLFLNSSYQMSCYESLCSFALYIQAQRTHCFVAWHFLQSGHTWACRDDFGQVELISMAILLINRSSYVIFNRWHG